MQAENGIKSLFFNGRKHFHVIIQPGMQVKTDLIYINEFHSPRELRREIEKYVQEYNTIRPHQSLDNATPESVFQSCFQIGA